MEQRVIRYLTLSSWARKVGISETRAREWAREGRLPGARKIGAGVRGLWLVPEDAPRPTALRPWENRGDAAPRAPRLKEDD